MLLIKENREKENKTEAQYILEGTAENLRYYRERIDALQKLEAKTPVQKKKLLDEIHKLETEAQAAIFTETGKQEDARPEGHHRKSGIKPEYHAGSRRRLYVES